MAKKNENIKPNIVDETKAKTGDWLYPGGDNESLTYFQKYRNMQSWRTGEISEAFIDKLSCDLMTWADMDDSYRLTQFLRRIGMTERSFYLLTDKNTKLKEAHWYAMAALGDRREIGAIKQNPAVAMQTLDMYCSTTAASEAFKAELRRENKGTAFEDLQNCIMERIEQKWGNNEDDSGAEEQVDAVPAKAVPDATDKQDRKRRKSA